MASMRASSSLRLGAFVGAVACVATIARAEPARMRVLVFDVDAPGVSGSDVVQLPDLISQTIAAHPGYDVVPVAELRRAVSAHQKARSPCASDKACLSAAARATHADIAVTTSYRTHKAGYRLELARIDPRHPAAGERTGEQSPDRADLPLSTKACLARLFKWPDSPTVPVGAAAVSPAPATALVPPAPAAAPESAAGSPPLDAVPHRESLAVISVTRGEGFTESQASTIEELLLGALDGTGKFKVIGRRDIDAVLSLKARKQSVGCSDTDCAVQIAGALGVDLVATANVGRLGTNTVLTLSLIAVRSASVLARAQESVQSDNDLPNAARALADQIVANRAALEGATASTGVRPRHLRWQRVLGWVGVAVGGALLLTGAGLGISSLAQQNEIHTSTRPGATALQIMNSANTSATFADVTLIGGGVLAAGGVGLVVAF